MAHGLFDISRLEPAISRGCTLLTPNLRLSRRIADEWDSARVTAGDRLWEPLSVHPLQAWLQQRWDGAQRLGLLNPCVLLTRQQELILWRRVIAEHARSVDLLRPDAAAELALEARDRLVRFGLDPDEDSVRQVFSMEEDCTCFLDWLAAFESTLEKEALCTSADAVVALAGMADELPGPPVVLVECDDLAPVERAALQRTASDVSSLAPAEVLAEGRVHSFAEPRGELAGVARWAASVQGDHPGATVAIVLEGAGSDRVALEYLLRREFGCLGEDYNSLPVNFSAGISLASAPVVRDALAALSTGLRSIDVQGVESLLRSRFLDLPDAASPIALALVSRLYAAGSARVDTGALRTFAATIRLGDDEGLSLGRHLSAVAASRVLRGAALPSAWVSRFNAILDEWGWPGDEPLDSLEYQQVERWYQTLDEYRGLDAVQGAIEFPAALELLREACEAKVSHPQTVDSPVQVLGPLEAVGLSFDFLWVCRMEAGRWPSPPRPNPFIPLSLQSSLAMPHATPEREMVFSRKLFRQYRSACGEVHASYSRQVDGVPELPSPLLADLVVETPAAEATLPDDWRDAQAGRLVDVLPDHEAPVPSDEELAALRGGSAILTDQSACAFRAFARRRLRARAIPDAVVGLSPLERGSLVHAALESLWQVLRDRDTLAGTAPDALDEQVQRAVQTALEGLPTHRQLTLGAGSLALEQQCIASMLHEMLAVERERGDFTVDSLEEVVSCSLGRLEMTLRADRVDRLPDGSRVIIDYKTGQCAVADWLGERPRQPQLPLYAMAAPEHPAAVAFARVRPGECGYVGLGAVDGIPGVSADIARATRGKVEAEDWVALNGAWRASLQALAEAFLAGDAAVAPMPRACQTCDLHDLCRVAADSGDDAVEEA